MAPRLPKRVKRFLGDDEPLLVARPKRSVWFITRALPVAMVPSIVATIGVMIPFPQWIMVLCCGLALIMWAHDIDGPEFAERMHRIRQELNDA